MIIISGEVDSMTETISREEGNLKFDLTDYDARNNFLMAIHAKDAFAKLFEVDQTLRTVLKYGIMSEEEINTLSSREVIEKYEEILEALREEISEDLTYYA